MTHIPCAYCATKLQRLIRYAADVVSALAASVLKSRRDWKVSCANCGATWGEHSAIIIFQGRLLSHCPNPYYWPEYHRQYDEYHRDLKEISRTGVRPEGMPSGGWPIPVGQWLDTIFTSSKTIQAKS